MDEGRFSFSADPLYRRLGSTAVLIPDSGTLFVQCGHGHKVSQGAIRTY